MKTTLSKETRKVDKEKEIKWNEERVWNMIGTILKISFSAGKDKVLE